MTRRTWYLVTNSLVFAWFLATAVVVLVHRFVPASGWLMVHLLVLGAVSTAVLIWSQHFADTLSRRQAVGGRRWLATRLAVFTLGALLVVTGMVGAVWAVIVVGAIVVAAAASAHAVTLGLQLRGALPSRFGPLVRYYLVAAGALVAGVGMGVLLSSGSLQPVVHARLYLLHLTMNLLGWLGLTVLGTVLLLWPTVLHARAEGSVDVAGRRALPFLAAGLVLVAVAVLADLRPLVALGIAVYLAGLALVVAEGIPQARAAKPGTFAAWSIVAAVAWFAGCTVTFATLIVTAPTWPDAAARVGVLVPAFVVGFAAQIVTGALSYLLPVVAGGGPDAGRAAAVELDRAGFFRLVVTNAGLVVALLPVPSLVQVAVSLVVFAALLSFPVLVVRALLAARRVRAGKLSAGPRVNRQEQHTSRTRSGMAVTAAGVLALAVAIGVVLDPAAAGIRLTGASPVRGTGHTTTVEVTAKNLRFHPATVTVPAGDRLVIHLTNADDMVHDLVLESGANSGRLAPGASATLDAGVIDQNLDGWCSVAGHRQLGMVFAVKLTGARASGGAAAPPGSMPGMTQSPANGPSAAQDIDLMKTPAADFSARDPNLAPVPAGTVHKVTLKVSDLRRDVAPGVEQTLWTFGGTAPGPTLHGKVGDTFQVTLINDGTVGHSIDFHAGEIAPDEPMRTIAPGQELLYRFTAHRSGIWLYHCATVPMSLHIANGMFGAVVIDPPDLDPVDHEYVMLQSEFYLGAQGGIADAAKIARRQPDLVAFNGYADQYVYRPITVRAGERVRVWVLDAGPDLATSFHVIGTQFDTVFKEGDYLLKNGGSTGTGGSQALGLEPAQGGFVEFALPAAGDYPFISHIMSDAEKGAKGLFHVTG